MSLDLTEAATLDFISLGGSVELLVDNGTVLLRASFICDGRQYASILSLDFNDGLDSKRWSEVCRCAAKQIREMQNANSPMIAKLCANGVLT